MKAEEQNVAIAKALGWKWENHQSGTRLLRPDGTVEHNLYAEEWRLPQYQSDANTRPEMLAALTEDEIDWLCDKLFTNHVSDIEWAELTMRSLCMSFAKYIVNLTQPKFAELWLKVKGLWKE